MQFYVLKPEDVIIFGTAWAYADQVDPVLRGNTTHRCPVCDRAVSGLQWLPPHRIKLSSAKPEKWGDFLWGAGFPLMVSERFRSAYDSQNLTGIVRFYPSAEIVQVGRKKVEALSTHPPQYHLITVKWNGANLDDMASNLVRENIRCAFCRSGNTKSLERVVIEPRSWDGSDIFIARGLSGKFLVSQRFKELSEVYNLKNTLFIPIEDYAYDVRRPGGWYRRSEVS